MFAIEADTAPVLATFDKMIGQLHRLPNDMHDEMQAWQTEDMKRARPNIEQPDQHSVMTRIWPRSRRQSKDRGKKGSRKAQRRIVPAALTGIAPQRSGRPILRPSLYELLVERMRNLLASVKWSLAE